MWLTKIRIRTFNLFFFFKFGTNNINNIVNVEDENKSLFTYQYLVHSIYIYI